MVDRTHSFRRYETQTLLNSVFMSDTRIDVDTRTTLVGHLSVKCSIQKIFVGFLKFLAQF